jgi:hypothetical protein
MAVRYRRCRQDGAADAEAVSPGLKSPGTATALASSKTSFPAFAFEASTASAPKAFHDVGSEANDQRAFAGPAPEMLTFFSVFLEQAADDAKGRW